MKATLLMWNKVVIALATTSTLVIGCGGTDTSTQSFKCEKNSSGHEYCKDNKVRYCHATTDTDGHFHWGADCEGQNLKCVAGVEANKMACVDTSTTCEAGASKCESNTAYNCVNGSWGMNRCGTAKECKMESGKALCNSKEEVCGGHGQLHEGACECNSGYKIDPDDKSKCIAE